MKDKKVNDWHTDENYIDYKDGKHSIKYETHSVYIETENLKKIILDNHKNYNELSLKDKKEIIEQYAEFENDSDLLEFLMFMEEE